MALNHQINEGYVHVTMKVLGSKMLLQILNKAGSMPSSIPALNGSRMFSAVSAWPMSNDA
jgi:hypothetical protein